MKIVSWNCNCKFREKFAKIRDLDADVYIIQECENPAGYKGTDYDHFAKDHIWTGDNMNKGLGIFARQGIEIKDNRWGSDGLRYFISARINDSFDLIGVWACKPYIQEYYTYQAEHIDRFNDKTVIMGDFNSNSIWDSRYKGSNHSIVIKQLEEIGLVSAYHYFFNEAQGEETQSTFYLYRHPERGYHIDHCFAAKERIKDYRILSDKSWMKYSDHIPVMLEIW